jgi:hypothetical protein
VERDRIIRVALWVSVFYNLAAAIGFAFPDSAAGQMAGFPTPVPQVYSVLLAFFVAMFGGAYMWLARQPVIDRPMVAFFAIGKGGVFLLIVIFWLTGAVAGRGVLTGLGDLVLACIFGWWVLSG